MSGQPSTLAKPSVTNELTSLVRSWRLPTIVAAAMVLLALVGVGLTTTNSHYARHYWIWLVPIYGVLCIGTAWSRGSKGIKKDFSGVLLQVLHWLGVGVAIGLDFLIRATGEETSAVSGLSALLILALGCFLAGVHLEWLFAIVGLLLTLTLFIVAKAEQYQWVIFVVGGLILLAMFGWHRIRRVMGAK